MTGKFEILTAGAALAGAAYFGYEGITGKDQAEAQLDFATETIQNLNQDWQQQYPGVDLPLGNQIERDIKLLEAPADASTPGPEDVATFDRFIHDEAIYLSKRLDATRVAAGGYELKAQAADDEKTAIFFVVGGAAVVGGIRRYRRKRADYIEQTDLESAREEGGELIGPNTSLKE